MTGKKNTTNQDLIDPDDAPELTDEFFRHADEYVGKKLIQRGRPKSRHPKISLTVRYDQDVIDAFKAMGEKWQTRMNDALRDWLKSHA